MDDRKYIQIKKWVLSRFGGWQFADDLIQFIAVEVLQGRKSNYYYIYCDFVRSLGPMMSAISAETKDIKAVTEDDLIFKIDAERNAKFRIVRKQRRKKFMTDISVKQNWKETLPVGLKLREVEYQFIYETLKALEWNRSRTADVLGIALKSVRNKLAEMRLAGFDIEENQG